MRLIVLTYLTHSGTDISLIHITSVVNEKILKEKRKKEKEKERKTCKAQV
jgi:hypothetical protein